MIRFQNLSAPPGSRENQAREESSCPLSDLAKPSSVHVQTGTMNAMGYRSFRRFAVFAFMLVLVAGLAAAAQDTTRRGRKYKAPPPTSRIDVTVLRNDDGKPVENAAVVFHLIGDKGNM